MALNIHEIDNAITGGWSIFLHRKNALSYFKVDISRFIWSFNAIILIIIFQLYMLPIEAEILSIDDNIIDFDASRLPFQMFILAVNWFIWPFIAFVICKLMELEANFIRYIIIDNLSSFISLAIMSAPIILYQFGLPKNLTMPLMLLSSLIMLLFKWRVAQVALGTDGIKASIFLFIDVAFTIMFAYILGK